MSLCKNMTNSKRNEWHDGATHLMFGWKFYFWWQTVNLQIGIDTKKKILKQILAPVWCLCKPNSLSSSLTFWDFPESFKLRIHVTWFATFEDGNSGRKLNSWPVVEQLIFSRTSTFFGDPLLHSVHSLPFQCQPLNKLTNIVRHFILQLNSSHAFAT